MSISKNGEVRKYPYIYVDGIYPCRNWGGEYEHVIVIVAIAVNKDGYREVLGAAEGMKEDKASWTEFFFSSTSVKNQNSRQNAKSDSCPRE